MPSPETILGGLRLAATRFIFLAVIWHIVVLVFFVGLIRGSRTSRRIGATVMALPIVSASVVAFVAGNPFNGSLLGATSAALIVLAWRLDGTPLRLGSTLARVTGAVLIAFAWIYPHFLDGLPPTTYLWAAPMGVIPCPTLSLVIGFALAFDAFESRSWSLVLSGVGLFYGIFGAARLGVVLDVVLIGGASALLVRALLGFGGHRRQALATHQSSG